MAATTRGDGDALGFTADGDGSTDLESFFVGWRSGGNLGRLFGDGTIDISIGRQEFQVGDGFLVYDGNFDALDQGAFWLAPRGSFENTALLRVDANPLRGDVFYLEAGDNHDDTELAGINLEYASDTRGSFGVMYFLVLDSAAPELWTPRDGIDVLSLRAAEISLPGLSNLALWGEYATQSGEGEFGEKDAQGWYVEAQLSFDEIAWTPTLSYRHARFSGDDNPNDDVSKDFDPFFYGFSRSWGTWFQGEVAGNYMLFNTNQVNHMLGLSAAPSGSVEIGALYFDFALDANNYFGTPVSSDRFGDEINLYVDWSLTNQLSAGAVYGVFRPAQGAKEAFWGRRGFPSVPALSDLLAVAGPPPGVRFGKVSESPDPVPKRQVVVFSGLGISGNSLECGRGRQG